MDIGQIILEATKLNNQLPDSQFCDVISGTVVELNPLKIKISDKLTLTQENLILSAFVQETWINIPTTPNPLTPEDEVYQHRHLIIGETEEANDGGQGASPHKHSLNLYTQFDLPKILLWRGLLVGDVVYMLRVARGQSFMVLQRVEGITNEK